jgi:predicted Rossmann fold nucleotide-binding protein DprA/Smf involved in DNA uptake
MNIKTDTTYWITIAHLERWGYERINDLIIKVYHEQKSNWETFFELNESEWKNIYKLSDNQIRDLLSAKNNLPNNSFLAEDLLSQGFEIIPINSQEYSKTLKLNLKKSAPPVLYVKGNKQIMQENSIAIVGSRDANEISLQFTDNIAKLASKEYKVIVSGFAKGVDKQALDSSIKYKGQSIIVLPQGIMTFASGFKKYYKELIAGDVLVLSTFHPKAVWNVGLAMARNPIIYGLSKEIYVAQSSDSGGTWEGVMDGLKKGRIIYVRKPENNEKSANNLLIKSGAVPVDFSGNKIEINKSDTPTTTETVDIKKQTIEEQIIFALKSKPLSAKQLIDFLNLQLTTQKLSSFLKKINYIEPIEKTRPQIFRLRDDKFQTTLFK